MDNNTLLSILDGVPASRRPEVYQALTGDDPSKAPMRCERAGCANVVALEATYSPALFMRHTGSAAIESHVCDESLFGQHYYCSLDCADAGVQTCWSEHVKPKLARLHDELKARQDAQAALDAQTRAETEARARLAQMPPELVEMMVQRLAQAGQP